MGAAARVSALECIRNGAVDRPGLRKRPESFQLKLGIMKQRLMIVCDAYFPGELGGGGMWAVYNLASHFSNRYDFFIVTRDCDGRIDNTPYVKILRNKWTLREEAEVYYASPSDLIPKR